MEKIADRQYYIYSIMAIAFFNHHPHVTFANLYHSQVGA